MDSFLGVPIRAGETVFGNLYLTEKPGGFDAEDERRVQSLSVAAGVAIRNAQLIEAAQVGGQWQAAAADMANAALRGEDGGLVLQHLARSARQVAQAHVAIVASPHDGEILVEVVDGPVTLDEAETICASVRSTAAVDGDTDALAACLDGSTAVMMSDVTIDGAGGPVHQIGCFPVATDSSNVGTLVLVWTDPAIAVTSDRIAAVQGMAVQAAVSLTLDVARLSEQKLLVFRDRDRIARDLHDLVVQRLFASGVSLQVLVRRDDLPAPARERLTQLIAEIDATIEQIRDTIFELREGFSGTWQVTERLQTELDRMTESLGFKPALQVDADITTVDADDILGDAVAVVRESLSNVARHAHAGQVTVRVWTRDGDFGIEVQDDGTGPAATDRRSGIENLSERARARGGSCDLAARESGGSSLTWTVPLHVLP
jgi:signal transduction histidine kinase